MDPKSIAIGLVATAALVVAVAKPGTETKEYVAATISADDVEVAEIVKASPTVQLTTCEKKWAKMDGTPRVVWCCSDIGCGDSKRATLLDKRAGAGGVRVTYTPTEKAAGGIGVDVKVYTGEVEPMREEPPVEEPLPVEKPVGEIEKP